MRFLAALLMMAMVSGSASAQSQKPIPRYGEEDTPKTQTEIEADRQAERAYKRSLGNVPDSAATADPWGSVRGASAGKPADKAPAKRARDNPQPK